MFENHRKSLIRHYERSEIRSHFEWTKVYEKYQFLRVFEKACNQSNSVTRQFGRKLTKNARNINWRVFEKLKLEVKKC